MSQLLGIGYKVASVICFVVMMIFVKLLSNDLPIGQIIFFRSIFGLLALMLVFTAQGQFAATFRVQSIRSHLPWALSASISMGCFFVALTLIPLPQATAISFVMPLITTVLAWLMLGEKIRIYRGIAILTGLTGVSIIIAPSLGVAHATAGEMSTAAAIGSVLALCAASCWALAQIFMRRLTRTESSGSAVMSFSVCTLLIALLTLAWGWVMPDTKQWLFIACCGLAGGMGQFCVAQSLRYAEASTVAPFEYLLFPISSIAAALLFSEYPSASVWLGLPFVIIGGLFVIYREHQLAQHNSN